MPGLAARRNASPLAPIQTSLKEKLPMATQHDSAVASELTAELKPPPVQDKPKNTPQQTPQHTSKTDAALKPRRSLSSLFDLFSKPNVERSRAHRETLPPVPDLPKEYKPVTRQRSTLTKGPPRTVSQEEPLSFGSKASRPQLRTAKSARSLRTVSNKDDHSRNTLKAPWRPPPLFQAYPQAVMHTSLEAPGSSHGQPTAADKKAPLLSRDGPVMPEEIPVKSHKFFGRMKSKSRLREDFTKGNEVASSPTPTSSRKVYVLVTSGYLLQYAGDGSFDRLPEKILKLAPESVAFASDAIEGKHWVLEVLQTAKADNYTVHASHKTFMSKLGMQTPHARRLASSMFLVFGTPDEMDSWMVAIRKEIGVDGKTPGTLAPQLPSIKRYSSIVRQPKREAGHPSPALNSTQTSPTVVSSQRASSTVVGSASSTTFPSRFPAPLSPNKVPGDSRPRSTISSSDQGMIGPALKSPGFFERHRTPMTAEFADAPWTGSSRGENPPPVPSLYGGSNSSPHYYPATLDRRRSIQSMSSKSSNAGGDPDGLDFKQQPLQHRHSVAALANRTENIDAKSASLLLSLPSPALQHFPEPPRRAVTMPIPNEMESIAESPPPSRPRESINRPIIAGVDTLADSKRSPYTRASASFTPGAATLATGTRAAKRNSVFARPIPIATPQPTTTVHLGDSSDPSSRRTSMRDTSPISRRASTNQETLDSNISSARTSQEKTLRRPASIIINPDNSPFLTASGKSPRSSVPVPVRSESEPIQQVHASRPSSGRSSSRSRSSAAYLHFPPPRPPPTMPLPAPPVTTN